MALHRRHLTVCYDLCPKHKTCWSDTNSTYVPGVTVHHTAVMCHYKVKPTTPPWPLCSHSILVAKLSDPVTKLLEGVWRRKGGKGGRRRERGRDGRWREGQEGGRWREGQEVGGREEKEGGRRREGVWVGDRGRDRRETGGRGDTHRSIVEE